MTRPSARTVIGEPAQDDYILRPTSHAGLFKDDAPALSELLQRANLAERAALYQRHDREAIENQARYSKVMTRANLAVLTAAILGGLSMALQILSARFGGLDTVNPAIALATAVSGGLGGMWLFRAKQGALLERWMTGRAAAELARIDYFNAVAEAGEQSEDLEFRALLLEYLRRFQFDVQTAYYDARRQDHRKSADFSVGIGGFGALVSTFAAGGVLSGAWTASGALGVIGAAIIAYSVSREQLTQDRRNAERYGHTLDGLTGLRIRMDDVRDAIARGNAAALSEFIAAIETATPNNGRTAWRI